MSKLLTLEQVALILNLPKQKIYYLDDRLMPILQDRGSKMKTRLYDPAIVENFKDKALTRGYRKDRADTGRSRGNYKLRKGQDTQLEKHNAAIRAVWHIHLNNCKTRNLINTLEVDEYVNITTQNCNYCDESPVDRKVGKCADRVKMHGIDRVDNNLGYIQGNCVACCYVCNKMKSNLTREKFLQHINKIANHSRPNLTRQPDPI